MIRYAFPPLRGSTAFASVGVQVGPVPVCRHSHIVDGGCITIAAVVARREPSDRRTGDPEDLLPYDRVEAVYGERYPQLGGCCRLAVCRGVPRTWSVATVVVSVRGWASG